MEKNKILQIALANVLVEKYWLKGLLSDEQKHRLCEKNYNKIYLQV